MRILIVEDARRLREMLLTGFRKLGYAVDTAGDGEEALHLANVHDYDVVILDLMLPRIDGLTVLRKLREQGNNVHVLILTAKDAVPDKITGLKLGADDYLPKPFSFDELIARVQALARRKYGAKSSSIVVGSLTIDVTGRQVARDGDVIALTTREYVLLEYLAHRKGRVVSRQEIEEALYDGRMELASNTVDSAICLLRKKIDSSKHASYIQTRRGLGYILAAPEIDS